MSGGTRPPVSCCTPGEVSHTNDRSNGQEGTYSVATKVPISQAPIVLSRRGRSEGRDGSVTGVADNDSITAL